jgi:adenine C2-methylase RlmN of 23S rRNA A2503 and tRNA A37
MPNSVSVPISIGELYDKISILQIKAERIHDKKKLENIELELVLLNDVVKSLPELDNLLCQLNDQLKEVNETLWDCEESIRDYERRGAYGEEFVATARAIHRNNDRRAEIKRQINLRSGSSLVEEKSYLLPELVDRL